MKLRTLSIVVLVLAVLSAIAFYLQRPAGTPSADARLGQPLLAADAIEKTAALRVSDQGKTATLVRQPDSTWKVANYFELPADFSKLSRLISDLADAKLQRLVTSRPDRIARLDFKDTKIELLDTANQPVTVIALGKHAESGGGRYVRFGDESKAYLTNLSTWLDAEPKNWAQSQLLQLTADDVAEAEITFPDGAKVVVSRPKKEEPWVAQTPPEGQRVKAERINSLLASLSGLRFSETTEPTDPQVQQAGANPRTVKLTTFDQKTVTIALGRKPEEKKLKPPAPAGDGKSGPAALGSVADLQQTDQPVPAASDKPADDTPGPKPLMPEYETIPAGPVFVRIAHSDAAAPVNALMAKRAFQVSDYVFTGLPQKADELFEPVAPPPQSAPAVGETAPGTEPGGNEPPPNPPADASAEPAAPAPSVDAKEP